GRLAGAARLLDDARERQRRVVRHREVAEELVRGWFDDPELAHAASINAEQGISLREVEETLLPAPELGADPLEIHRPERPTAARAGACPLLVFVLAARAPHRRLLCLGGWSGTGPLPPAVLYYVGPTPRSVIGDPTSPCSMIAVT